MNKRVRVGTACSAEIDPTHASEPSQQSVLTSVLESRVFGVPLLIPKQLETEEMNRIVALCKRACAAEGGIGDMAGLMEEVSVDYLRTMNKIVLEAQTKEVKNETVWV